MTRSERQRERERESDCNDENQDKIKMFFPHFKISAKCKGRVFESFIPFTKGAQGWGGG